MANLSERGKDALVRNLNVAAGVSVTLTRKAGGAPVPLTVVPGQTVALSQMLPGRVEITERDYQVTVADLMVAGVERPPLLGDRFAETINGVLCVFEVANPKATGEPAVRYGSSWRAIYRVHTKRVS